MYSRARVEIPAPQDGAQISIEQAMEHELSEAYGTVVTGIDSEFALHQLFAVQGLFLLRHIAPDASHDYLRIALRTITKPHKHEAAFWQPENDESTASARVVVPYVPQYDYLQRQEEDFGTPLRMTFGLQRTVTAGERDIIRVARANVWISSDHVSPFPNGYRIVKDINTYREFNDPADAQNYFDNPQRVKARCGFVIKRLLEAES